jgi:hypothetical protein
MIRALAKFWAKRRYVWNQEREAATTELNAKAAAARSAEKRALVAKLTAQADAIEANIKKVAEEDAKKEMSGQEKYESDRERREAEKMIEDYRNQAKQLETDIQGHEDTVKVFTKQAAQIRNFAELLRKL